METIDLPLIQAENTTTDNALYVLKVRQRSGLIAEDKDRYTLLYWRQLLEARRNQVSHVSKIPHGYPVHLLGVADMRKFNLDLVRPMRTQPQYEKFFGDTPQVDYALVGATSDSAIIVTRHEPLKYMLSSSTGAFKCNGVNINHFFPDPEVVVGQNCPKWPECLGPGGTTPIISPV